jgi:hypothetical protein
MTKSPTKTSQTTGGKYTTFEHLSNIQNTNGNSYAISSNPVTGKKGNKPRPSTVTCSNFKFNLPSDAVVKKVTVYYRHRKKPVQNVDQKLVCNIPAPTISVGGLNLSKKASAPANKTGTKKSVSWTGLWEASKFNGTGFNVVMNYPSNSNDKPGYVLLSYIYVALEYYTPSFTVSGVSANKDTVFNYDDYHLKVSLSDANLTGKGASVLITSPLGFAYSDFKGNGTVTRVDARNVRWTPSMNSRSNSQSVELIYGTNVTFATGSDTYTGTFNMGISGTTITATHTATITKPIPSSSEDEPADPVITDDDITPASDYKTVYIDEEIPIDIQNLPQTVNILFAFPIDENGEPVYKPETTPMQINEPEGAGGWELLTERSDDDYIGFTPVTGFNYTDIVRCREYGAYCLRGYHADVSIYYYFDGGYDELTPVIEVKFICKPEESDLTVPNMALLEPTEEELHRLGDGYPYILQSNLQLNSQEDYVRDWYKNFRLGVFNNRIEANCTTYYQYDNTETEFDGYFILPGIYDLTDAQLRFDVDNPISLTILEDTYDITTTETIDLFEEYRIPVTFTKDTTDNVIITITLIDTSNQEVYSVDYHINFQATETTDIQELIDDSTDYSNLTDEQIFYNAKWWSTQTAGLNTSNNVECDFTYEEDYPIYIIVTGDYPEGDPSNNTISFTEPCIIEETQYNGREPNGNYPVPIDDLVLNDGSTSELTMEPYTRAETIVFYDLPLTDNYGTNTEMAIRGIELTGNVEQSDRITLYARLQSPNGESRERSIILDSQETSLDTDNTFTIGGNGDLWGFSTLDIINLEDWEIELTATNTLEETTANLNYGDIQLNLYIEQVQSQNITCYINGEDIRYYGVFLTDIKIPEGLQTDTKYLDIDGTDTNDAYRQNIREKTITIEFDLGNDCNIEANTQSLREFTKLLVNDRDEYNRPIPKRIEFSHYPDVYWEYIMEETVDHKLDIGSYIDGKVKLTIPAGTSYDKEPTTTSNTGYVNGIATIHPNIIFKPTDTVVTIRETVTGQEFHIGYTGDWNDKIVELDCDNRIAWLKTNEDDIDPVNLNKYVDYNSDWFRLKGEYSFTGVNCIIRTVDYSERW